MKKTRKHSTKKSRALRSPKRKLKGRQRPAPLVVFMRDVSGSMGDEQEKLIKLAVSSIETEIRTQFERIDCRYITHDAAAREVDQEMFYKMRETGGTAISAAYRVCMYILEEIEPSLDRKIYVFHFSDGDNLLSDNEVCFKILRDELLPKADLFCYWQVRSLYGSGEFKPKLEAALEAENLITAVIHDTEDVHLAIRYFLSKGRELGSV